MSMNVSLNKSKKKQLNWTKRAMLIQNIGVTEKENDNKNEKIP